MSEIGELFSEHRKAQKERRAERLPGRQGEILALPEHGFTVTELTPYQFRVNGQIDLYPIHRRYHDVKKNKRGNYRDALGFLKNYKWEKK